MESQVARKGLFLFLFLVLFVPFLQHCLVFVDTSKLKGAIIYAPDVTFSYAKWWDGSYQTEKANFLNERMGFRRELVQLNNQIDFDLFENLHLNTVIYGKDGYLLSDAYIYEYNGLYREPDSNIRKELVKLKYIQDTLERLGKTVLFVEAASKCDYYPEKFPNVKLYTHHFGVSNYTRHVQTEDSLKIHHIDMNAWFKSMKGNNSQCPVFSKHGIHWTMYGSLLVADTLIKYIDRVRNIQLPSLQIKQMKYSDTPRYSDGDIAVSTNLIFPLKSEKLCYPEYTFVNDGTRSMPKMIFIGDSFLWSLLYNNFYSAVSKDWEFWYYFNEVWNGRTAYGLEGAKHIKDYNWQKSLSEADCIILLYAPVNLGGFRFGDSPIEMMYNYYYPAKH